MPLDHWVLLTLERAFGLLGRLLWRRIPPAGRVFGCAANLCLIAIESPAGLTLADQLAEYMAVSVHPDDQNPGPGDDRPIDWLESFWRAGLPTD